MSDSLKKNDSQKFRNSLAESSLVQLRIGLDEPASELRNKDLVALSKKLCSEDGAYTTFVHLADDFGMSDNVSVRIQSGTNPDTDIMLKLLKRWTEKKGGTVRMLILAMNSVGRKDCADYIENVARYQYTSQCIRLHVIKGGREFTEQITSERVPEKITLEQYVRTLITETISTNFPRGLHHCYMVELKALDGLDWSSTAKEYVGRQIDLYLFSLTNQNVKEAIKSNDESVSLSKFSEDKRNGIVVEKTKRPGTFCPNLYFGFRGSGPKPESSESDNFCILSPGLLKRCLLIKLSETGNNEGTTEENLQDNNSTRHSLQTTILRYIQEQEAEIFRNQEQEQFPENLNDENFDLRSEYSVFNSQSVSGSSRKASSKSESDSTLLQLIGDNPHLERRASGIDSGAFGIAGALAAAGASVAAGAAGTDETNEGEYEEGYATAETLETCFREREIREVSRMEGFVDMSGTPTSDIRAKGEQVLLTHYKQNRIDGCYIIRQGQSGATRFTLACIYDDHIYNLSILYRRGQYSICKSSKWFDNIRDLVKYYKENDIQPGSRLSVAATL